MILIIHSFLRYQNYTLNISDSVTTLIQGRSGAGKTTILSAIYWCLYGGTTSGKRYKVEIEYENIKIFRQSKPNILTINTQTEVYQDLYGQQYIYNIFGTKELFDLCCYMSNSNCPCPLLSSSTKERLYYLSKLAFADAEDPSVLVEKIHSKLLKVKKDYSELLKKYEMRNSLFKEDLEQKPIRKDLSDDFDPIILNEAEYKLSILISEYEMQKAIVVDMEKLKVESSRLMTEIEIIEQERLPLSTKITQSDSYDEYQILQQELINNDKQISEMEIIMKANKEIRAKIKRQKLRKELIAERGDILNRLILMGYITEPVYISSREFYKLENLWNQYKENKKKADDLDILYDNSTIQNMILDYQKALEYKEKRSKWQQSEKLRLELPREQEVAKQEQVIQDIKRSLNLLKCPNCNVLLRYHNNKLHKENVGFYTLEELTKAEQLLREIKADEIKRKTILEQLKKLDISEIAINNEYEEISIDEVRLGLKLMREILVIPEPSLRLEIANLLVKYAEIIIPEEEQSISISEDVDYTDLISLLHRRQIEINIRLREIEQQEKEHKYIRESLMRLDILYGVKKQRINYIDIELEQNTIKIDQTINDRLAEQRRNLELITKNIEDFKYIKIMREKHNILLAQKEKIIEARKALINLKLLYRTAVNTHYLQLRTIINRINICISSGISRLFSYPITMNIDLIRIEQANKTIKHKVAMICTKRGEQCSSEKEFSGGEWRRIVFVLVVALNMIHKTPLLMFDEIMASLDAEYRQECLELVKDFLHDKTILFAEHFAQSGDYDDMIPVRDLNIK